MLTLAEAQVAVIGLGYVGLPLAVALAGRVSTLGFDIDAQRVAVVPGDEFGGLGRNHIRISFACGEENIRQGLGRIVEFAKQIR